MPTPTPRPILAPVDMPLLELAAACVGLLTGFWVAVGVGVDVVVEEVVGAGGGPAVSKRFRRLREC
jgi:hypothetical protein